MLTYLQGLLNDAFFKQNRIVYLKQSLTWPKNKSTENKQSAPVLLANT